MTLELKELIHGKSYDVWVTATTTAGEGPATRKVTHSPSHRGTDNLYPSWFRTNYQITLNRS